MNMNNLRVAFIPVLGFLLTLQKHSGRLISDVKLPLRVKERSCCPGMTSTEYSHLIPSVPGVDEDELVNGEERMNRGTV